MTSRVEVHNCAMDSTRWDAFRYRDGDIVIAAWGKSGTTWTQQIVGQLIFDGRAGIAIDDLAPWIEFRLTPLDELTGKLEQQTHRRFVKTHLRADAIPLSARAKYLYLGRDGRDIAWSMYNHLMKMSPALYDAFNNTPGRVGPPIEQPTEGPRQFFLDWLDGRVALWPFWSTVQSWWDIRDRPNVMLLHFNELKTDLPKQIRRIAEFLGIRIDEGSFDRIVEHCTFDYMRANADRFAGALSQMFTGGMKSFIHKGTNGRWRDDLTAADLRKYDETVRDKLTPDCAAWLAEGSRDDAKNARAG